jgi:predicted DNA-binding protein
MLKTYLYIPEQLNQRIYLTAKNQNKSKAEVIRLALENGINAVSQQGTASALTLQRIASLGKQSNLKGPNDSSTRMDELLWEKDWGSDE